MGQRVPRHLNPRKTALPRLSNNCKLQIRPLEREGAPLQPTRICLKMMIKEDKLVAGPRWLPDTKIDWPTDRRSQYNFDYREYGRRDPSRWPRGTLYPHKLAITSPISGDRSVGIVRSRTQTTEFSSFFYFGLANDSPSSRQRGRLTSTNQERSDS
jgi:hypothetical protein